MFFTPTAIKNLLKKPATRNYPFTVREPFDNYRGELIINIDDCIFCGMCSRKCPSQCIEVDKATGTWSCNPHACVYCGICRDHCPTKCLSMKNVHRKPLLERTLWVEKGTPPKSKKKAAPKEETAPQVEAHADAPEVAPVKDEAPAKKNGKKSGKKPSKKK